MVVFNLALIYIDLGPRPVSRRFGISTLASLRLFSRAPSTRMRSCESPASRCTCDASRSVRGWPFVRWAIASGARGDSGAGSVLDPDVRAALRCQAAVARRSRRGRRGVDIPTRRRLWNACPGQQRGRIVEIDVLANPARLGRLGQAV